MYGDLQFTNTGTGNKFKGTTKVYKFSAGPICDSDFIVGFTGTPVQMIKIVDFFRNPDNYKTPPRCSGMMALVLTAEKDIFLFEDCTKWLAVDQKFHAIGSGAQYALGVLENGGSPKDAVRAAMKHDIYTGLGVKGQRH